MADIFPTHLIDLLVISVTLSMITMVLIQKFKCFKIVNKCWKVFILNTILSIALGVPFTVYFYNLTINDGIWVSIFTFIGAPTIYQTLKNQTLINYNPQSLKDGITIEESNIIER